MSASFTGSERNDQTTEPAFSNFSQMAEEASKYIRELETWLEDHGTGSRKPWPEMNIANKERRLAWVVKAKEIFDRGARRDGEAA